MTIRNRRPVNRFLTLRMSFAVSFIKTRGLHASVPLCRSWRPSEDTRLLARFQRYGPVWDLIQLGFIGRRPQECRRRWLHVSGLLAKYSSDRRAQELLLGGYEPHHGSDNTELWLRFPIENAGPSPFARFCAQLPEYRRRRLKRKAGWPEIEKMALQQGFDELGPNWEAIAKEMHRRTLGQCRRFLEHRNASTQPFTDRSIRLTSVNQLDASKRLVCFDPSSNTPAHYSDESAADSVNVGGPQASQ